MQAQITRTFHCTDVENDIIDNFPFDRIDVEVWFIEHHMVNQPFHSKAAEETDPSFVQK